MFTKQSIKTKMFCFSVSSSNLIKILKTLKKHLKAVRGVRGKKSKNKN